MDLRRPSNFRRSIGRRTVLGTIAAPFLTAIAGRWVEAADYKPTPLTPKQKVSVGLLNGSSDAALFVAADRGYFEDEGLDVDLTPFKSSTDMLPILGRGQLDVGAGGVAAGLFNAVARGIPLKIVADKGHMPGPHGDEYSTLMVRKELLSTGKIRSYADLKGTRIALVGGLGSTGAFALAKALSNGGLSMKDVTTVSMVYPDLIPAFANGSVDAAIVIEPFQTLIETQGTGVIWKTYSELFGHPSQIAVIFYSSSFAGKEDLARRFMIAYLRGARGYNDAFGKRHDHYAEIVDIIVKHTRQKAQIIEDTRPPGIDPDGRVLMVSLQEQLDFFTRAGQIEKTVDLSSAVDRSFADFAVGKLGPYRA